MNEAKNDSEHKARLERWAQIILIVATGMTNLLVTRQTGDANRYEIDRAKAEVHEIWSNQKPILDTNAQTKETNEALKKFMAANQNAEIEALSNANAQRIESLTKRIEQLERTVAESKSAAQEAADSSERAATASVRAAGAASVAANSSSAAKQIVRTRVVTTEDKKALIQQQQKLQRKSQQLSSTIKRVKKHGPTLWDKIIHQ